MAIHQSQVLLDQVIDWLRNFLSISDRQLITAPTRIEADLHVTGDDGDDLLIAAMEHFNVNLNDSDQGMAQTLQLASNECWFGTEAAFALPIWSGGSSDIVYRDLTVGELHKAIHQAPPLSKKGELS